MRASMKDHSANHRYARLLLVALALTAFLPGASVAASYYVAKTGNDNNSGTEAAPFLTISKGVSVLAAGDTLYVKAGTYAEYVRIHQKTGTSSSPITIKRFGTDVVVVDGRGINIPVAPFKSGILVNASRHIVVDGFESRNWTTADTSDIAAAIGIYNSDYVTIQNCVGRDSRSGLAANGEMTGDYITIQDCEFSGSRFHGLRTEDTDFTTIRRVISRDNSSSGENDGIHIGCSRDVSVEDSLAYNNYEQGFDASGHCTPSSQRVTFRNCVAHHNGIASAVGGFKVEGWQGDTIAIENSLSYSNGWGGFTILGSKDVTLKNSTSWDNGAGLVVSNCSSPCVQNWQTGVVVLNNIIYDKSDSLTVRDTNTSVSLNYNDYYLDSADSNAIDYKSTGSWSLASFGSYQSATGQDANSKTANPGFVDKTNPAGPDGIFFTADDGLLPGSGSPVRGAGNDGKDMGYHVVDSSSGQPDPPANVRIVP